jgi:hypothetical protein
LILTSIYIGVIGIAFFASLFGSARFHLPRHLRIFSILLGCTLLTEVFSVYGVKFFHLKSNVPYYNFFMLAEFWTYAFFYSLIIRIPWMKKVIIGFLWGFPLFWLIVVFFVFGLRTWNSYLFIVGGVFTVCFSFSFYYQLFTNPEDVDLKTCPEFWIATGLIIFYTCNLPYIGMLNFLVKNYLSLAKTFLVVLKILNILMYSLFTYAFLCRIPTKKLSLS